MNGQTVTVGHVRGSGIAADEDFIQADAAINPGNSGGTLRDAGLRPGNVIQESGRQPVREADEASGLSRRPLARGVLRRVWSNRRSRYLVLPPTRGRLVP